MADVTRKLLLVYPRFARNLFLNMEYMASFYPKKKAVMPSLGLLTLAGRLRQESGFELRLVDENITLMSEADLAWSDVVCLSGMHPHRPELESLLERANAAGKLTVLGGPSVSICPEFYPQADVLHVGEMGDATDELIALLHRSVDKPARQIVLQTANKTPLSDQPVPAYDLVDTNAYVIMPVQFSVGCPFSCEFCDIPMIYGNKARLKDPERIVQEMQAVYDTSFIGTILFVDDNLIAHKAAAKRMLPAVIEWQKANNYPFPLTAEASVNLAADDDMLQLLQEARLTHMFLGVESPDPDTLNAISKTQNTRDPLIESIRRIQSHGIEVIMGMIFGFDNDTEESGARMRTFVAESNAPIVYFNLLAALPKTPLWDRLSKEGRLLGQDGDALKSEQLLSCLTTNVQYKLPNDTVVDMLLDTVRDVYSEEAVFARERWNAENVYGKQVQGIPPVRTWKERGFILRYTIETLAKVLWRCGIVADYRARFWSWVALLARLRLQGRIRSFLEVLLRVTPNAHHLIEWGRVLLRDHATGRIRRVPPAARPAERERSLPLVGQAAG